MSGAAEYKSLLHQAKRAIVRDALERNRWNVTHTARVLGIQRSYLSRLMRRLELHRPVAP